MLLLFKKPLAKFTPYYRMIMNDYWVYVSDWECVLNYDGFIISFSKPKLRLIFQPQIQIMYVTKLFRKGCQPKLKAWIRCLACSYVTGRLGCIFQPKFRVCNPRRAYHVLLRDDIRWHKDKLHSRSPRTWANLPFQKNIR